MSRPGPIASSSPVTVRQSRLDHELRDATRSGTLGEVADCLDRGANPNKRSRSLFGLVRGRSAVILAARREPAVMQLLLDRGGDVNAPMGSARLPGSPLRDPDTRRDTALHQAIRHDRWDTVQFLVNACGADVTQANASGVTASQLIRNRLSILHILPIEQQQALRTTATAMGIPVDGATALDHAGPAPEYSAVGPA